MTMLPYPLQPDRLYVLCTQTESGLRNGFIGTLIQWITRNASRVRGRPSARLGPYRHMALLSTYAAERPARSSQQSAGTVYEALPDGWRQRPLTVYRDWSGSCDVFRLLGLGHETERRIVERARIYADLGTEYDHWQLVAVGLERFVLGWRRPLLANLFGHTRFICSEGVALCIRMESPVYIGGEIALAFYTPTDIRHTLDLGLVAYDGALDWIGPQPGITAHRI